MPRTGITLCHPKIGYVNATLLFRKQLALNSPLGHLNGDNAHLSTRRTKTMVTLKFNSYNCNMSFVKIQRTQSLPRPTTHAAISTFSTSHNSISSPYSQSNSARVLQHQKQTQYSMLQIKTLFLKTPFDYRHLIFFILLLLFLTT